MMPSRQVSRYALAALVAVVLACCADIGGARAQDYAAIVASPDRSDADRQNDKRRNPEKMMAFTGVKTGMKVMDLFSSGGYSAELLARSVGLERHGLCAGLAGDRRPHQGTVRPAAWRS